MFSPKKESCLNGMAGNAEPLFAFVRRAGAETFDEVARTARLKLRDKALPERLVIASLLCDSAVILYALVFSYWFREIGRAHV